MLEKVKDADAEQADAILAGVRRFYVEYLRSHDGSKQAQPMDLGSRLVNQFSEAGWSASVFDSTLRGQPTSEMLRGHG